MGDRKADYRMYIRDELTEPAPGSTPREQITGESDPMGALALPEKDMPRTATSEAPLAPSPRQGVENPTTARESASPRRGEAATQSGPGDGAGPAAASAGSAPPSVAEGGTLVPGSALSAEELARLTDDIVAALKTVHDPEIPSDIYELGLIYKIDVSDNRDVAIEMTLTAPACPVAGEMPKWVEDAVNAVPGVSGTTVKLVFDPPWDTSRMSDEARLALNMF